MAILAAVLVPVLVAAGFALDVVRSSTVHDTTRSDAIVVLGAAQFDGQPSPVFANRLAHAQQLYTDGVAPRIVTVGGRQTGDRFTEAAAGRQWLLRAGIPATAVVEAGGGTNTRESIEAVDRLARERGWQAVTITTDPAHAARSSAIAQRLGLDVRVNPTSSGDGSAVTGEYVLRETLALAAFEFRGQFELEPQPR